MRATHLPRISSTPQSPHRHVDLCILTQDYLKAVASQVKAVPVLRLAGRSCRANFVFGPGVFQATTSHPLVQQSLGDDKGPA
jgi:hypothetical protein